MSGTHGPNAEFLHLRCFSRPSLQPPSAAACLWGFLPPVLSQVSEKHAQLGWEHVPDRATEEFLYLKLFSQYVLDYYPFAL